MSTITHCWARVAEVQSAISSSSWSVAGRQPPGEEPSSRRAAEEGARPGHLFLPTDPQNQHKVRKTFSMWFDFSSLSSMAVATGCLVFSDWTRVGGGLERSGFRAGDIASLPVLHTPVLMTWSGGRGSTNGKRQLLRIFNSHAYVCEMDGSRRVVIARKELTHSAGVHGLDCPQTTPTPAWTSAEKSSDIVTIIYTNPKHWK